MMLHVLCPTNASLDWDTSGICGTNRKLRSTVAIILIENLYHWYRLVKYTKSVFKKRCLKIGYTDHFPTTYGFLLAVRIYKTQFYKSRRHIIEETIYV